MSEKEKQFTEMVSKFPPDLQDKFLNQATGAMMALDAMGVNRPEEKGGADGPGKGGIPRHDGGSE